MENFTHPSPTDFAGICLTKDHVNNSNFSGFVPFFIVAWLLSPAEYDLSFPVSVKNGYG